MSDQAIIEKILGNEAYKKRDFATAHTHYDKAIELDPANATFYSNKAAAFFEEAKYDDCIKQCEKAVEVGRENRADYSIIAKAYTRAANAYQKQGKLKEALDHYGKSLVEHLDDEVVKKQAALEKKIEDKKRLEGVKSAVTGLSDVNHNVKLAEAQCAKLNNTQYEAGRHVDDLVKLADEKSREIPNNNEPASEVELPLPWSYEVISDPPPPFVPQQYASETSTSTGIQPYYDDGDLRTFHHFKALYSRFDALQAQLLDVGAAVEKIAEQVGSSAAAGAPVTVRQRNRAPQPGVHSCMFKDHLPCTETRASRQARKDHHLLDHTVPEYYLLVRSLKEEIDKLKSNKNNAAENGEEDNAE